MTVKNIYPWGNFKIDDETGLPLLFENYFYRVSRASMGTWEVQLRRKRKSWFSKKEETRTYGPWTPITEDNILAGAAQALTKWMDRDKNASNKALLGDYPPKRLEQR